MCTVDYSATCSSIGRESVSTVNFRVVPEIDADDENENSSPAFVDPPSSSYEATVAFLWGEDDRDDIGNNIDDDTTTIIITDVYPTGEIITLSDSHTYDELGLYRVGYRFRFGTGAGSCKNKTSSVVSLIRIEERSCQWGVDANDDVEVAEVVDEINAGVGDLEQDVGMPTILSYVPSIAPTAITIGSSGAEEMMGKNESLISVIISEPVNKETNGHTSDQNDNDVAIPDDDVESSSASPLDNNSKNETTIPTTDDINNGGDNKTSTSTGVTPIDQTMGIDGVQTIFTTVITRTWPPSMAPLNERGSDSAGVTVTMRKSMGCCLCSVAIIIYYGLCDLIC